MKYFFRRLPGYLAFLLMFIETAFWTFWGTAEMYHEGWWGPWYIRLAYLVPLAIWLTLSLIYLGWPRVAGVLWLLGTAIPLFLFGLNNLWITIPFILTGGMCLFEGYDRRCRIPPIREDEPRWWPWLRHNVGYLLVVGIPLLIFIGVSVNYWPVILTRQDDGYRGERLIEGNGVTLVWAPAGPGWNWKQSFGGYPSWQSVALYGYKPIGMETKPGFGHLDEGYVYATQENMDATNLCRYLSQDGLSLMDTPQDIWRMPTTDEIVRTLGRHGENAGCTWDGSDVPVSADCAIFPDKESPLWASDLAPIYYWTADEYDKDDAYFVSYNGMINATRKGGGNPRHSYRCVRAP